MKTGHSSQYASECALTSLDALGEQTREFMYLVKIKMSEECDLRDLQDWYMLSHWMIYISSEEYRSHIYAKTCDLPKFMILC